MIDYIARSVPGYGYLPIIEEDGVEIYRGEFAETPEFALAKCTAWMKTR